MRGLATAAYSTVCYVVFLLTFLYAIGFVEGLWVPKSLDSGPAGPLAPSLALDALLLGVFALQHSVMARPAFKRLWTRLVPPAAERSTYVLFASAALGLVMWQWRPAPSLLWSIQDPTLAGAVFVLSLLGFGVVLLSTFLISHPHLFGLRQGFARLLGLGEPATAFTTPLLYRWMRHPLYAGFIVAFWAAPRMSLGRLAFAAACTGYILIGIWFEERDLVTQFGERYLGYRRRVGMFSPRLRRAPADRPLAAPDGA